MARPRKFDLGGTARSQPSSCLATQNYTRVRHLERLRPPDADACLKPTMTLRTATT